VNKSFTAFSKSSSLNTFPGIGDTMSTPPEDEGAAAGAGAGGSIGGAIGGPGGKIAGGLVGEELGSRAGDAWERRANKGAHDKWNNKGRKDRGYGGGWRFSDEID